MISCCCTLMLLHYMMITQTTSTIKQLIEGGEFVDSIEEFPHSAFLKIKCYKDTSVDNKNCGASIINQVLLLTAAHCFDGCSSDTTTEVVVGSISKIKNKSVAKVTVKQFIIHEDYSNNAFVSEHDIALLLLTEPLVFSDKIKRVSLVSNSRFHMSQTAMLAGWGYSNEEKKVSVIKLKKTKQKLLSRENCISKIGHLGRGTICGVSGYSKQEIPSFGYGAKGDSGSALVLYGYNQLGIVSFKRPASGYNDIMVYTDVSYHLDWIKRKSAQVYCRQ